MIYCPSCGTANRDGSRFCNECGTKLPTMTSSLCPTCGTLNPPLSLFCEKCGTRLIASLAEDLEEPGAPAASALVPKGLSLPTIAPAEPAPSAGVSDQPGPEEAPGSAGDHGLADQAAETRKTPTDELLPEWVRRLRATPEAAQPSAAEEEIPDWLKTLGTTGQLPTKEETPASAPAAAEETPPGAAHLGASAEPEEELPEWLREPPWPYFATAPDEVLPPPPPPQAQPGADEMPDWLRDLRPAVGAEEALPEWLDELGVEEQPASESMALATGDSALDWLSQLGATAPEPSSDQAAAPAAETPAWLSGAGEEAQPQEPAIAADWLSALRLATPEIEAEQASEEAEPEWLREESGAAPEAIGGTHAYDQEVPDWLRGAGAVSQQPSAPVEEEIPEWLREPQPAIESAEAPPPAQPEEGVPDWLKALGGAAAGAAAAGAFAEEQKPEEVAPQKPAADWLSALRLATPEIEAEQASDEAEPEWLREESGAAPQAIGGPQAYDQEVPDWLREIEPAVASEALPAEDLTAGETPDWLRELAPTAVVAGAAMAAAQPKAEAPEEIEKPEAAAETKAEAESGVSKAAPVALAGLAAVAVAGAEKKPEKAEPAPVEMPEWLEEIRQEQQAAGVAIPAVALGAVGLTQAEIPAWLEALRPIEEAAAPKETEAPTEMTGPLAGIASALPPAPVMDEMHGRPATLQFAVSAEDQARAGVLRELLTRHAVAAVPVEQYVVKGSAVRRRALRWIVAFLIITALFVPVGIDINRSTGLPLLPNAQKMVVPPAVSKAAYEIARVAQLPPDSKVLVVFDYDAAQSGELNRVAAALLKSPALRNARIEIASLNPQGSAVAYSVMRLTDHRYTDLGFTPGQVNGVQSVLAKAGDVKLIIELAASPETARWWAEQLQANRSEIPLVVGVSAGAEPLTMPYVQSGQIKGLVSGFPGAVAYLSATGMMNTHSQEQTEDYQIPLEALALANYVMAALIVGAVIAALLRGAGRRPA